MLERALAFLRDGGFNAYCVSDGTETVRLQPSNALNNVYSLSKNFTTTAIGMLCARGRLSVEQPIVELLPDYPIADQALAAVTVRHLLTHTIGHGRGFLFEDDRYTHGTDDWVRLTLDWPLAYPPGAMSVYSNANYYLLSVIAERVAGVPLFDFLRANLFVPLGFGGYDTGVCPAGHTLGATEMFFGAADLCKLGSLYVNDGVCRGTRYLDSAFVREAVRPLVPNGKRYCGFNFWRNTPDAPIFYGSGAHGQILLCDPATRAVLAVQAYDDTLSACALADYMVRG